MIIDVNALGERSKSVEIEIAPEEADVDVEHANLTAPVAVSCTIDRNGVRTSVDGVIKAQFEIDCTRCLESVTVPLEFRLDVEFIDSDHFASEGEHEIDSSELSADVLPNGELDMDELVREQLLLNLPEQVFCRPDCKGLCEICGTNRNLKDCDCAIDDVDPRWSALKDLK